MRSRQLQLDFGLLGITIAAYQVLEWTYVAPEGSSKSVVDMLHIIAEIYAGIKDKMVDIVINLQDYTQYWKGCRDKTSSSVSGLCFWPLEGHIVKKRGSGTSLNVETEGIPIRVYSHTLVQSTTGDTAKY